MRQDLMLRRVITASWLTVRPRRLFLDLRGRFLLLLLLISVLMRQWRKGALERCTIRGRLRRMGLLVLDALLVLQRLMLLVSSLLLQRNLSLDSGNSRYGGGRIVSVPNARSILLFLNAAFTGQPLSWGGMVKAHEVMIQRAFPPEAASTVGMSAMVRAATRVVICTVNSRVTVQVPATIEFLTATRIVALVNRSSTASWSRSIHAWGCRTRLSRVIQRSGLLLLRRR